MNKNSSSGISLLIPALNEAEAIKLTLDLCSDILGSEKYPYEIIVIDDGSNLIETYGSHSKPIENKIE